MRADSSEPGSRRGLFVKLVLLAVVALAIAWLAIRAAAVDAMLGRGPAIAAIVAPDDPRIPMALSLAELRAKNLQVSPRAARSAARAFAKAPLADEPLLVAGYVAAAAGDGAKAEQLLTEALRRNPRSRPARLMLLDRYLRTGRVRESALQISLLARLLPEAEKLLVPALAQFARDRDSRKSLSDALRGDPALRAKVLANLAATGAAPEIILSLAEANGTKDPEDWRWQAPMIQAMVDRGEVDRAFAAWSRFSGVAPSAKPGVYDGRFEGKPGSPPFNWRLTADGNGVAERSKTGSLQVEYYGRAATELASQLLMLPAGNYRLSARAEGQTNKEGGRLAWQLRCAGGEADLAAVPLHSVTFAPRTLSAAVTVPSDCRAQWLKLVGIPSEFPESQSVTISDVRIEAAKP